MSSSERLTPGSMMSGMTARTKIAVSLPSELVGAAKQAVAKGLAPNVSAYVARAMEEQAKLDDLDSLLAELLEATGGPLTDEERAEVDREAGWS